MKLIKRLLTDIASARSEQHETDVSFLERVSGVVHVGANIGQERDIYDSLGLKVVWIEPIPRVFQSLEQNLSGFPDQLAFQCLITDTAGEMCTFHVANNGGRSSSLFDLLHHKDIWPEVHYTETISLKSTTLTHLFHREQLNPADYQALIMDTQGSELLVLKGSISLLPYFEYIKTEAADFESYQACCQLADIASFVTAHGYVEYARHEFARRREGGRYYDVVDKRTGGPGNALDGKRSAG